VVQHTDYASYAGHRDTPGQRIFDRIGEEADVLAKADAVSPSGRL
jgi:hypothetical protein